MSWSTQVTSCFYSAQQNSSDSVQSILIADLPAEPELTLHHSINTVDIPKLAKNISLSVMGKITNENDFKSNTMLHDIIGDINRRQKHVITNDI